MNAVGRPSIALIALALGSLLAPFGVPPLPPDAVTLRAAPEECLLFAASAGTAQPDAASENHTDQLLANDQMQQFFTKFATQVSAAIAQLGGRDKQMQPIIENAKPLVETLLSRPAAIYIDRIAISPGTPPSVVAGLIVNCGQRKAEVAEAIEALEKEALAREPGSEIDSVKVAGVALNRATLAQGDEIHWGFKGDYFLAAIGTDAAAELLARIKADGPKPAWMMALEKQAAIKRVSSIRYLDVARLIAAATPMISDPDILAALKTAGVSDMTSVGGVTGFGTKGMVDRTFVNFNGTPKGLFELFAGKPLTADDLKPIPNTATVALALRLDPAQLYQKVIDVIGVADPPQATKFKQMAASMAQAFGFRLEEDVLGSLGDVWTLHNTIAGGSDQLAGIVATVSLKNKEMFTKIQTTALQMLKLQAQLLPFSITETKIGDTPAWRIIPAQTGAASPAWTIAAGRLVIAGSLETLKAQVSRESDSPGLGELPAVASRLKTEPVLLTYQDTKAIVEQWLGMLGTYGPVGTALLAQQGINVEMPPLPEFKAIASHVLPRTSTLRISKQAIVSEAFETVPLVGSSLSSAPLAGLSVALLLPAVQAARQEARQHQSKNHLMEIGLGMQNVKDAFKRFPPAAITDKSGKPLLSWRVKLLPYINEAPLYSAFHLDEPWDSENNKPLLEKMPAVYADTQAGDLGNKTVYLVPTGNETIFHDSKGTPPGDVTDGVGKTILVVIADAQHAVPWTKPDDLVVDKTKPADGLQVGPDGTFAVVRADGSVVQLSAGIDAATLWSYFTRAGGEELPWPGP